MQGLKTKSIVPAAIPKKQRRLTLPTIRKKVPAKTLAIFTRKFSTMLDAGLPLVQSLRILAGQQENKTFTGVLDQVRASVESGRSLTDSFKSHPDVFDDLYCNMIAAGEAGGILDTILRRLATHIEKTVRLKNQVTSAMTYPVTVLAIATVVVTIILTKVVPVFQGLFDQLAVPMPFPTRMLVGLSGSILQYGWIVLGLALMGLWALKQYRRTHNGRRITDGLKLKLPLIGQILRKVSVARFCRTLSTLTTSGVSILESLDITGKTSGNAIVEDAVSATRKSIAEGKTIAAPLRATGVFPREVPEMITVGEQTGALDTMLSKIADSYEEEVEMAIEGLIALMEPVMIALLGVVIGAIVIALYLPMFVFFQYL
ncbi:type II secretion system F family protein [Acidobacteriota bacterium]